MRQLLLVRHGESRWNAEGRIQGQSCAGLSARGFEQARALAAAYGPQLAELAASGRLRLVSSDLRRARETAAPLAAQLGLDPALDPDLRERAFGVWEGRSHAELEVEEADRWRRWTGGADIMREIGAETAEELATRAAAALRRVFEATAAGGVSVVVSHGGSIWHGLHRLLGLAPRSLGPVGNASVATLLLLGGDAAGEADPHVAAAAAAGGSRPVLASYNDLSHLPASLRTGGFTAGARTDAVPQMR
ncbi:MAG: histidine phosphatase family protein [Nitriliruptoraceae bacterium]